jgi:signal peptidase I
MPDAPNYETIAHLVDQHLSAGNQVCFWVSSQSMSPALQVGDGIIAESFSPQLLRPGDAILIQRERDYLTHRLIHKTGKKLLTKGDNNLSPDPPVSAEAVIGRVIAIQRGSQMIDLQTRKWRIINSLMAILSKLEWKAFTIHRYLRIPFRLAIKFVQKIIF